MRDGEKLTVCCIIHSLSHSYIVSLVKPRGKARVTLSITPKMVLHLPLPVPKAWKKKSFLVTFVTTRFRPLSEFYTCTVSDESWELGTREHSNMNCFIETIQIFARRWNALTGDLGLIIRLAKRASEHGQFHLLFGQGRHGTTSCKRMARPTTLHVCVLLSFTRRDDKSA